MTLWIYQTLRNSGLRKTDISNNPSLTIAAGGVANDNCSHYWLENDGIERERERELTDKPPYQVPGMAEIRALPWNGYKVVSTFSGCGGSCLGYRMAGFKVIWANEFVPAAQNSYRANMESDCILDCRDVKLVTAEDILKATRLKVGELDLFDGSPPCQAFSTAGKREKGWGKEKKYEHGAKQKNEELFTEYIRLLKDLQPKTFVAENVSGLVKGVAKGFFIEILGALKECGYNVKAKLLDAQWLGVPQMRQRIIFVGVREDLRLEPVYPKPLTYRYSVRDALPWITTIGSSNGYGESHQVKSDRPYHTVGTAAQQGNGLARFIEARIIRDSGGTSPNRWHINEDITDQPAPSITLSPFIRVEQETDISRYAIGTEWDKLKPGEQSEKYFSLVKPDTEKPCPTITVTGGVVQSAAGVCHPTEKRKFTIAELKRICAFPDDFILTGSYTQQWERLGNSVPPVMMYHIANAIKTGILDKINGNEKKARKRKVTPAARK